MATLSEQEINKTIAGYMEAYVTHAEQAWIPNYTQSLDACIPVVEKLGAHQFNTERVTGGYRVFLGTASCFKQQSEVAKSPALALATALAKAILEGDKE